jgi:predicted nucleic acid-binding protein
MIDRKILTLDSNIFIAALKRDETYSNKCVDLILMISDSFILAEPSIVYQYAEHWPEKWI